MQFTVEFRRRGVPAISMPTRQTGLSQLDAARQLFGPQITPDGVSSDIGGISRDVTATLSEAQARKAGGFEETHENSVFITGNADRFVRLEATKPAAFVYFKYIIDTEAMVAEWFAAGCPQNWDLDSAPE